jgi:hypothetical protein
MVIVSSFRLILKVSQTGGSTKGSDHAIQVAQKASADQHQKRKDIAETLRAHWKCNEHDGLPCWKESAAGVCYPITAADINLWATLIVRLPLHLFLISADTKSKVRYSRSLHC